jgi:para-nitrobenzyl esterase
MAVCTLLATPSTAGLYAAAIMQSGAGGNGHSLQAARKVTAGVAQVLDVPPTKEALAAVPPDKLVEATTAVALLVAGGDPEWGELAFRGLPFAPVVDNPIEGRLADVPMLLSFNREEWRLFTVPTGLIGTVGEDALAAGAATFGAPLDAYRRAFPDATPGDLLTAIQGDFRYELPARRVVADRPGDAPAWLARFDGVARDDNDGMGSAHATEIPYVFGTAGLPALRPRLGPHPSAAVEDTVHGAWVRFVQDHDPGWPAADRNGRPVALLGARIDVVADPDPGLRTAWSG